MHDNYELHDDGTVWHSPDEKKEVDDVPRPVAHIIGVDGVSETDLLGVFEETIEGKNTDLDMSRFFLEGNDNIGYITVAFPDTDMAEARLTLDRLEEKEEVKSAEFGRAYTLIEEVEETFFDKIRDAFGTLKARATNFITRQLFGDSETEEVLAAATNDPRVPDQYGAQQMNTFAARKLLPDTDETVTVVHIDSGADTDHEDLENMIPADAGEDFEDGVGGDTDPSPGGGRGKNHGTHTLATSVAENDNGMGIAGVAGVPNVDGKMLKIFGANPRTLGQTVANAIEYAVDQEDADVINMSIGGTGQFGFDSEVVAEAIEYADENGCICVAASGNAGNEKVAFPARHPLVLGVGAVDENRNVARFSNRGDGVDLAAAGVRVTSAVPGDDYEPKSGTSMASPHVAGAVAILWLAKPDATTEEIRQTLKDTAQSVRGADADDVGSGIPDLKAAVNALKP